MRIDRFLWFARLAGTRVVARDMACEGRLRLDGRVIDRAHATVRVGSILTFARHGRVHVVRIVALPQRRGPPAEGRACYEELVTTAPPANVSQESGND